MNVVDDVYGTSNCLVVVAAPEPTDEPTAVPTDEPTAVPTGEPTATPTDAPTEAPTDAPSVVPTNVSTALPGSTPTPEPTNPPAPEPTETHVAVTTLPTTGATQPAPAGPIAVLLAIAGVAVMALAVVVRRTR
jgi:hypothetical protein